MATKSETAKYTGKSHADNMLSFAADMGWLTASGRKLSSSELTEGMKSLPALSSVVLRYRGLDDATYHEVDIDGFISALQAAMDAYSLDCTLTFAADSGILFDDAGNKLESDDFENGMDSLRALGRVVIDDDGKTVFDIQDKDSESRFIKQLRAHLPAIEVIDLVDIAIDCGIVTDLTDAQRNFMSYKRGGNYYSALCFAQPDEDAAEQNRIFKFRLAEQDASSSDFYVTFDAQQNDIRSETEYASRASVFVDTLMKLVMAKFNVLIVHKAAMETDITQIQKPPVYEGYSDPICDYSDDDTPTESTQSQLKVLIRYKDTVKRTSFTANVIDDIFITFDELNRPQWGFSKITPGQSEPTPDKIVFGDSPEEKAREIKEVNNVLAVKQLSEQRDVKYTIFEELRRNKDSNLYKLIKQREEIYRQSAASNKEIPKVEFSLIPLTIYSNHIVSRTLEYRIVGKNPSVSTTYEYKFDPLSHRVSSHSVNVGDRTVTLTDTNRLVILLEKGEPGVDAEYIPGCESLSVRLSSVNPKYYPERTYGDVFYLKSKCVAASATGYTGLSDDVLFYVDDLEPSALSKRGVRYLRRDMIDMPVGAKYFIDGNEEPVLATVGGGEKKYAPGNCVKHECPICGTAYYADEDTWAKVSSNYKLVTGRHCCPSCAGRILVKNGMQIGVYELNSDGNTIYCVDDPENPQHIHVCSQCRDKGQDGLVFGDKEDASLCCSLCGEVVCSAHSSDISGKVVCNRCLAKGSRSSKPFGTKGRSPDADAIWKNIHINLPLLSRKNLNYSLHGRWLRVYNMKDDGVKKTYVFVARKDPNSLDDKKFVFVKAKSFKKQ